MITLELTLPLGLAWTLVILAFVKLSLDIFREIQRRQIRKLRRELRGKSTRY